MTRAQLPISYDYKSFTLNNGETDYDVDANQADLWDNIVTASRFIIKFNRQIDCKLNSVLFNAFTLKIGDTPFQPPPDFILLKNLFLSNSSGSAATIQIWLFG